MQVQAATTIVEKFGCELFLSLCVNPQSKKSEEFNFKFTLSCINLTRKAMRLTYLTIYMYV